MAPESFEYVLLNTREIRKHLSQNLGELTRTFDYCDSQQFVAWEQCYEELLKQVTSEHLDFTYNKRKLNKWFLNENCAEQYIDILLKCFITRCVRLDDTK